MMSIDSEVGHLYGQMVECLPRKPMQQPRLSNAHGSTLVRHTTTVGAHEGLVTTTTTTTTTTTNGTAAAAAAATSNSNAVK
jgi:hypothetical protein